MFIEDVYVKLWRQEKLEREEKQREEKQWEEEKWEYKQRDADQRNVEKVLLESRITSDKLKEAIAKAEKLGLEADEVIAETDELIARADEVIAEADKLIARAEEKVVHKDEITGWSNYMDSSLMFSFLMFSSLVLSGLDPENHENLVSRGTAQKLVPEENVAGNGSNKELMPSNGFSSMGQRDPLENHLEPHCKRYWSLNVPGMTCFQIYDENLLHWWYAKDWPDLNAIRTLDGMQDPKGEHRGYLGSLQNQMGKPRWGSEDLRFKHFRILNEEQQTMFYANRSHLERLGKVLPAHSLESLPVFLFDRRRFPYFMKPVHYYPGRREGNQAGEEAFKTRDEDCGKHHDPSRYIYRLSMLPTLGYSSSSYWPIRGKQPDMMTLLQNASKCLAFPSGLLHRLLLIASFPQMTKALSVTTNEPIASSGDDSPSTLNRTTDLAVLVLALVLLLIAKVFVTLKINPVSVWGTLMAFYSFGWWCIRSDTATSLSLSWAVLIVWCISTIEYTRNAFNTLKPPFYTPLITIGLAAALDVVIVGYMTPKEAVLAQVDLLNLSLPSASLALGLTAAGLRAYNGGRIEGPVLPFYMNGTLLMPELA